jgi:hypothetical protein
MNEKCEEEAPEGFIYELNEMFTDCFCCELTEYTEPPPDCELKHDCNPNVETCEDLGHPEMSCELDPVWEIYVCIMPDPSDVPELCSNNPGIEDYECTSDDDCSMGRCMTDIFVDRCWCRAVCGNCICETDGVVNPEGPQSCPNDCVL